MEAVPRLQRKLAKEISSMNPALFGLCLASVLVVPILTSFAVREVKERLSRRSSHAH
jgi:hypothetical protein